LCDKNNTTFAQKKLDYNNINDALPIKSGVYICKKNYDDKNNFLAVYSPNQEKSWLWKELYNGEFKRVGYWAYAENENDEFGKILKNNKTL